LEENVEVDVEKSHGLKSLQELKADDRDNFSLTEPMVDDAHEENGEDSKSKIDTNGEFCEIDAANLDSQL